MKLLSQENVREIQCIREQQIRDIWTRAESFRFARVPFHGSTEVESLSHYRKASYYVPSSFQFVNPFDVLFLSSTGFLFLYYAIK